MSADPLQWLLILPGIIIGLTVHEYAHARAANYLGDNTATLAGRLTLNPLSHIDIVGFLMLMLAGFGWAKPVPINPLRFQGNMRTGVALVSLAGPAANILLAFTGALIFYLSFPTGYYTGASNQVAVPMLMGFIRINIVLAVFNLIPLPPLDGSKILASLLPPETAHSFLQLERYGPLILIALIFTGLIGKILLPLMGIMSGAILNVAAIIARGILGLLF